MSEFCPGCSEELVFLDRIVSRRLGDGEWGYDLFYCNDPDCEYYGDVLNNQNIELQTGDPSGLFPNHLNLDPNFGGEYE